MAEISVIVVTFNSIDFIGPCLDSIYAQDYRDFEVIAVDNGSKDGTSGLIKISYPKVILIENNENLGACRARNQGFEAGKGRWFLTLDCDIILEKGFISSVLKATKDSSDKTGIIQPKILKADKKTIYSAGIFFSSLRRFYDIGQGRLDVGQFDKAKYIFGACSAASLYSRLMLEEIKEGTGYFDERFFFLFEDVDLSWRAQRKGWKAIFCPQALCYHKGNSSGTPKELRQYFCFRNRYFTIFKNEHPIPLFKVLRLLILYDIPRTLYLLLTNKLAFGALGEIITFFSTIDTKGRRCAYDTFA